MSILREELITNHLLLDYFDMWDEFNIQKVEDPKTIRYYNLIENHINNQIDASIRWLESDQARDYFFGESQYQKEVFSALEEEWDEILSAKYPSVEALLDEVYQRGKAKGYSDMRERIRFTESDKLAIGIARNYNYHLIRKIDNDTRNQIKSKITEAVVTGEHPSSVAPKILNVAEEKLHGTNFTPKQRATMIARTEISRVQNTGILQSYINEGYTEVKILTAGDSRVCNLCLQYAFEYEEDAEVTYGNRGEERTHNIVKLVKGGEFPPFHPLCRCTYLSVWHSKGEPPEKPFIINLIPSNYTGLEALFGSSVLDGKREFSDERLPSLNERRFKEEIRGFVNESDIDLLTNFLSSFIDQVPHVHYEFGAANLLGTIHLGFGNWEREITLPKVLKEFGKKYNIPILIHNHPYTTTPFPSPRDLRSYAEFGVHYGVTTNDLGTFIVKNNDVEKNKNKFEKLEKEILGIKKGMLNDFKEGYGVKYNKNNADHINKINKMIHDNSNTYFKQYEKVLEDYGMELMFI